MSSAPREAPSYDEVDPFSLPSWLGERDVIWSAERSLETGYRVPGALTAEGHDPLPCDLLAVDDAFPAPVANAELRVSAHRAWQYGEVVLVTDGERLMLAVPGSRVDAELALAAIGRLARAVGAAPESYACHLRVGHGSPSGRTSRPRSAR